MVHMKYCKLEHYNVNMHHCYVSDNTLIENNIVDICAGPGDVITKTMGYIQSPNYQESYPPDISCTCNFTTVDTDAEVVFTPLDVRLAGTTNGRCGPDWLEYLEMDQPWSTGTKMCGAVLQNATHTRNNTIQLNFRADDHEESRGFWLKYHGKW